MNILSGVIVSYFFEQREEENFKENDIKNNCFICNIDRATFERNKIKFEEHKKLEHNVKLYMIDANKVANDMGLSNKISTIMESAIIKLSGIVDFEKPETTKKAITATAVVANPVDSVEELEANERRERFIQQTYIDLHADILVAKKKLADLNDADSQAQNASSTGDTIGNENVVMIMKNFENQVQALEENLASMRLTLEGIKSLRAAEVLKEDVNVGGSK